MKRSALIMFLFSVVSGSLTGQSKRPEGQSRGTQTAFTAQTGVKTATGIPKSILKWISRDYEDMPGKDDFMHELEGSFVFLNSDKEPELLVQGPPGANITTFRLYRKIGGKWHEVLKSGAHDLLIERKTSKGFRNIATASMTAVTLMEARYKFDGRRYIATTCSEQQLGLPKTRKYFRCSND